MSKEKITEEDLIKAIDQVIDELESESENKVVKSEDESKKEEVIVKSEEEAKKDGEDGDDDDDEDKDKEKVNNFEKKKKTVKKSVEIDEGELETLKKAKEELDVLKKTEDESSDLKKAFDKIDSLQKAFDELKNAPQEKKSVDGLDVIQKSNPVEGDDKKGPVDVKSVLKRLKKGQVADIMYTELIEKGVEGVSSRDVCEYESTGHISNEFALNKTLEAIGEKIQKGLL